MGLFFFFFFSSRRRHTRFDCDWSSDVCSSDLGFGDLSPEAVLAVPPRKLRAAGLSGRKVASIRDLTAKVVDGTVPLDRIGRLADQDVITRLSVVRGIGQWTAEMFLIFQLRRLDVWPVGDYGVRKGYALAYDLRKLPTPKQLEGEGERFRPYRTVAAWYCWQAVREQRDRKSTRLNSSHSQISYAVFCLKKKN